MENWVYGFGGGSAEGTAEIEGRTADDVFDIYERSVGGNSVFLLNIPPNDKGRFSPRDEALMLEVGRRIRETYDTNLAASGGTRIRTAGGKDITGLLDGDPDTFWKAYATSGELHVHLSEIQKINRFMLQESLTRVGQRVSKHDLDAWIDGDPNTFWHSSWDTRQPHPHQITIDLGQTERIAGITYLPRQDKHIPDGMIERGQVLVSTDKQNWKPAAGFTFGNILNDPTKRKALFDTPQKARYIRVVSQAGAQNKPYAGAAEIGVLPATAQ